MKKVQHKIKKQFPLVARYFFDFLVVFAGVFLAFWLNDRKERQKEEEAQRQIYIAIYEDLNAFYISGREENEGGFINFFSEAKYDLDSLISIKQIPAYQRFTGDYWDIEMINSIIESGQLKDIDIEVFKAVTGFQVMHNVLLSYIKDYNEYYEKYITSNYDEDNIDYFYKPGTNELKRKYKLPFSLLNQLIEQSKMLVEIAGEAKNHFEREMVIQEKKPLK